MKMITRPPARASDATVPAGREDLMNGSGRKENGKGQGSGGGMRGRKGVREKGSVEEGKERVSVCFSGIGRETWGRACCLGDIRRECV